MKLITSLFLLLACAHGLGYVCMRLKQPALVGHMLAGMLIGPSILGWVTTNPNLGALADLGVLFVVLTAGLDMRLHQIVEAFRGRGVAVLLLGFLIPVIGGAATASLFGLPITAIIVVGLCIAVTALPVALQILSSFDLLQSHVARIAISSALLADIVVFSALGVLIAVGSNTSANVSLFLLPTIAMAIAKLIGLLVLIFVVARICSRIVRSQANNAARSGEYKSVTPVSVSSNLTLSVLLVLALACLSELLGFHFVIGAFFAATMITPQLIGTRAFERLEDTSNALSFALFAPMFLAYQGLQFDLQSLAHPALVLSLTAAAIITKLISGYCVGRLQQLNHHESQGVGIIMNARGVMELVAASIAFRSGLIDAQVFAALLIVGLVTTVLTPIWLARWHAAIPHSTATIA